MRVVGVFKVCGLGKGGEMGFVVGGLRGSKWGCREFFSFGGHWGLGRWMGEVGKGGIGFYMCLCCCQVVVGSKVGRIRWFGCRLGMAD